MKNRLEPIFIMTGLGLLFWLGSMLFMTSALFLVGVPVTTISFWLSIIVALVLLWWMSRTYLPAEGSRGLLSVLGLVLSIAGVAWLIGYYTYDVSFDGQTYHQEAIQILMHGWNPVYGPVLQPPSPANNMLEGGLVTAFQTWINHYAKGPWLLDALLYKLSGNIELGKMVNLLLWVISFLFTSAAFLTVYPEKQKRAILFSLLLSCNPVVVGQLLSFYIDGQLASCFLIVCALGFLLYHHYHRWIVAGLCTALVMLMQIKFTALVYAVILTGGIMGLMFLYGQRGRWKRLLIPLTSSFLIGVLLVGYNPYVTNTLSKGHPFYPLAGPHAIDIMTYNSPHDFKEANRAEKMLRSLFARSENIASKDTTKLKIPFTISLAEITAFYAPDVRVGGFGPLFSGVVLIMLCLLPFLIYRHRHAKVFIPFTLGVGVLFVSAVVNPECWWARYVPQLWLIPVLIALVGLVGDHKRPIRYANYLLLATIIANLFITTSAYSVGQVIINSLLREQLAELKASQKTVVVDFHHFVANRIRFQAEGIPYIEQKLDDPHLKTKTVVSSRTKYLLQ